MRDQISHVPNNITVWLFYVIHPIHMLLYVLPVHIHQLMNKMSYYLKTDKSMAHIYSGSCLCPGLAQEYRLLLPGTYHYAPHTALQIQATASGDLSLRAPHNTSEISPL